MNFCRLKCKMDENSCVDFHINGKTKFVIYPYVRVGYFAKNMYLREETEHNKKSTNLELVYYSEVCYISDSKRRKRIDCEYCKKAIKFVLYFTPKFLWQKYHENSFYELFQLLFFVKNVIDYQKDISKIILCLFYKLNFSPLEKSLNF